MINLKPIKIYEFIEVIVLIVLWIFIVYFGIRYLMAYAHGWTSETRYWLFFLITLILIMVFYGLAGYIIKGRYLEEGKKEEKKPINKNMIIPYISMFLVLSGGVAVVYLVALVPPKEIKNYYIVIIVSNILIYSGLILFIITYKSRRVEKPTPPIGLPRLEMLSDGEILEKRIRNCFKVMFYSIAFLFTLFQVFLFLFFISFNLVLFLYLGFLIVLAVPLACKIMVRKRIFSGFLIGEILEKHIRNCFKVMFYSIAFLFTLFQVFLFFIYFNLVVLFFYLGFLIVMAILFYVIVIIRKKIFSHESGFSINKDKVINEINKYNQKVKPCFGISIIVLIILFVIIILVASYSTIFILFYLLIGLMLFLMLLNLPLYAFGKLLNSALSKEGKE